MEARTSVLVFPAARLIEDADRFFGLPGITEFRRVMQDENGAVRRREALAGGLKMPGQNCLSLTRPLARNRYAALVFVQSWQANGIVWPSLAASCPTSFRNRRPSLGSQNRQPASSLSRASATPLVAGVPESSRVS